MTTISLQAKRAYYAKVRQSNYAASLRLAGFDVGIEQATRPLPSLKTVLDRYRKTPA